MTNELITRLDLAMALSLSPDTLANVVRHGGLTQYQPEAKRKLPCFMLGEVNEWLKSVFDSGSPRVAFRPISLADPGMPIDELARRLGVHSSDVRSWRWARKLPCFKIGHSVRFRVSNVQEWLVACNDELARNVLPNKPVRRIGPIAAVRG